MDTDLTRRLNNLETICSLFLTWMLRVEERLDAVTKWRSDDQLWPGVRETVKTYAEEE